MSLSAWFRSFGWTRDDWKWTVGIIAAVIVGLAALSDAGAVAIGLPPAWLPYLRGVALVIGIISGKMATSGLPGAAKAIWLPLLLTVGLTVACASLPVKQQATVSLQATAAALGAVQDAERALCDPTAAPTRAPITRCAGTVATAIGLTDARHQQFAQTLATAFNVEGKAAVALRAWKAGDPPPATLAELQADVVAVLVVVRQLTTDPRVQAIAAQLQATVEALAKIVTALRGAPA